MELYIGGYAQGKLNYVLQQKGFESSRVAEAELPEADAAEQVIIHHLHLWVKEQIRRGGDPEGDIQAYVDAHPKCVIVCDEIGNGIVPMEPGEREYRERTGRILIELAKRAERVERVVCGIGQRLK